MMALPVGIAAGLAALLRLLAGFSVLSTFLVAGLAWVAVSGVLFWRRRGYLPCDHRRGALAIGGGVVAVLGLLLARGSELLAPPHESEDRLPVYVGVVGYHLPLRHDAAAKTFAAELQLGPPPSEPTTPPGDLRFSLPLPESLRDAGAANAATRVLVTCEAGKDAAPERCRVELVDLGPRRDYLMGVRSLGGAGTVTSGAKARVDAWTRVGLIELPGEAELVVRPVTIDGAGGGDETAAGDAVVSRERRFHVRSGPDEVQLGACRVRRPGDREEPLYLTLLDLYYMEGEGCRLLPLGEQDVLDGRWIRRDALGRVEIPAHSFLEIGHEHVRFVPLEDRGFRVTLSDAAGKPLAPAERSQIEFAAGERVQLALLRRVFTEQGLSAKAEAACAQAWRAARPWWHWWEHACRRVKVTLEPLTLDLKVDRKGGLDLSIDKEEPQWRRLAYVELPPADWERQQGQPRGFIYLQGWWPTNATERTPALGERTLDLPFRLWSGLQYRAELRLTPMAGDVSEDARAVTVDLRDSEHRMQRATPLVVRLGSEVQAVLELDRAAGPWQLARAALVPSLGVALGLLMLLFLRRWPTDGTPDPEGRGLAVAALLLVPVAWALLEKAMVAYAVMAHAPYDWEAFDQLLVAALVTPGAVAAGVVAGLVLGRRLGREGERTGALEGVAVALLVGISLGRLLFSVLGREALGPVRLVVMLPWALGLFAYYLHRARGATSRLHHPVVVSAVYLVMVAAWYADKGALLLLAVPAAALVIAYAMAPGPWQRWRLLARVLTGGVVLGLLVVVAWPGGILRLWSLGHRLTALDPAPGRFCERHVAAAPATQGCVTAIDEGSALEVLEQQKLLDPRSAVAARRHPLRRLDWLNDGAGGAGAGGAACGAVDRLPTRDALEVGFFRALIRQYTAEGAVAGDYLRGDLLPFPRAVTDALLNDYLGTVAYLPQLPRGSLLSVALLLLLLWALVLGAGDAGASGAGFVGLGELGLLAAATALTVGANLDVYPNFAQSLPLLAIRSNSAWLLDGGCLFLATAGLVAGWQRGRPAQATQATQATVN